MTAYIARIRGHAPDWKSVTLEWRDAPLERGSRVRLKWHHDADLRRGTATVFARVDDSLWFTQPLYEAIPAAADLDYVYLVED